VKRGKFWGFFSYNQNGGKMAKMWKMANFRGDFDQNGGKMAKM